MQDHPTTSHPDAKPRAVIYDRVSTLLQARAGYSHGEQGFQIADCRKLAEELGADVVAVIEDTDSGAAWNLPGLNRVFDMAERHEFDILICQDPDRLARGLAKQLLVEEELKRHKIAIRFFTLRGGDSPEDRLLRNVKGAVSEYEREKIAFRLSRGIRQKATLGRYVGTGKAPYGYRYVRELNAYTHKMVVTKIEPDPHEAPIVVRIFAEATTQSLGTIARHLNAEQVPLPGLQQGQCWHPNTLRRILTNPVYKGTAAYGRFNKHEKHDPATWITISGDAVPALVDAATWEAVQDALAERKKVARARIPATADPFMLRAALTCGHCGGAIVVHGAARKWRYYYCAKHEARAAELRGADRCPLERIPAEPLEAHVWQLIGEALLDEQRLMAALQASRAEHDDADRHWRERRQILDKEIRRLRATLRELVIDRANARRGGETWRMLNQTIEDTEIRIEQLTGELAKLQPAGLPGMSEQEATTLLGFAAEIRRGLECATPVERRQVCQLLKLRGRVVNDPEQGRAFGRHRHRIEWEAVIRLPQTARNGTQSSDYVTGQVISVCGGVCLF